MACLIESIRDRIGRKIIQFGPPRTGSTLVWNSLRAVFPGERIPKLHSLDFYRKSCLNPSKIVCTVRNPLDALVSSIRRYGLEPTPEVVARQIAEFRANGMDDVLAIAERSGTLLLRYEEFVRDFDVLFDELGRFFGVKIAEETRRAFSAEFDVREVKRKSDELGAFANFDHGDHIHGRHVSDGLGSPGQHAGFLGENEREEILRAFRPFCERFGYSSE